MRPSGSGGCAASALCAGSSLGYPTRCGAVALATSGETRPTTAEQIERLTQQIEQAQAKKRKLLARQRAAELKARRSADTRRKILLGAWLLGQLDDPGEGPRLQTLLADRLPGWLERDDDRALLADLLPAEPDSGADKRP